MAPFLAERARTGDPRCLLVARRGPDALGAVLSYVNSDGSFSIHGVHPAPGVELEVLVSGLLQQAPVLFAVPLEIVTRSPAFLRLLEATLQGVPRTELPSGGPLEVLEDFLAHEGTGHDPAGWRVIAHDGLAVV